MGYPKRASVLTAVAILAALIATVGVSSIARRDAGLGSTLVAFPAAVEESAVLSELRAAGVEGALGATTTLVPLSDFSRVVHATFLEADSRANEGDPRRTPFLDELRRRFSVSGPDGAPWSVVYLPASSQAGEEAVSTAFARLGCAWASNATRAAGSPRFLWIPSLAWLCYLVARKPRRDRLGRAALALSWLPLLYGSTLGSTILFVTLEAATMSAYPLVRAGLSSLLTRALWPYAVAVAATVAFEPGSAKLLAAAAVALGAMAYLRPRIERLARRGRLHEPPSFKSLSTIGATRNARSLALATAVPIAAVLVFSLRAPPRALTGPSASTYGIERVAERPGVDAKDLLRDHIAFQEAITFGRIGDAVWGKAEYAPAFRYTEESGRMRLSSDAVEREPNGNSDAYKGLIRVLSDPGPGSIR